MGGVGRPRKPDRFRMVFCGDSRGSLRPRASLDAVSGLCVDPPARSDGRMRRGVPPEVRILETSRALTREAAPGRIVDGVVRMKGEPVSGDRVVGKAVIR